MRTRRRCGKGDKGRLYAMSVLKNIIKLKGVGFTKVLQSNDDISKKHELIDSAFPIMDSYRDITDEELKTVITSEKFFINSLYHCLWENNPVYMKRLMDLNIYEKPDVSDLLYQAMKNTYIQCFEVLYEYNNTIEDYTPLFIKALNTGQLTAVQVDRITDLVKINPFHTRDILELIFRCRVRPVNEVMKVLKRKNLLLHTFSVKSELDALRIITRNVKGLYSVLEVPVKCDGLKNVIIQTKYFTEEEMEILHENELMHKNPSISVDVLSNEIPFIKL